MDMNTYENFFDRKKNQLGVFLNDIQKKAVLQTEGPLLLLASPGSGKTTTIIMRVGYLIEELNVDPTRIKAVTFSKASAKDMKERFNRFFPKLPPIDFSTIHSFAYEVVREHFRNTKTSYQIIEGKVDLEEESDTSENPPLHKKFILRKLFKSIVKENITDDQMDQLTTYISYIKNKMIPVEKWSQVTCDVPEVEQIILEYEEFKKSGHNKLLIDFDDMLTIANEVLEGDQTLLRKYQQRYDYILTDESQDTSMVQHAIIEKLVKVHNKLCVVADDDQSIYSWRGAEPSYLLNFKQVYPNAVTLFMEQNYRSSKDIVDVANQFIKRNKNRYNKNMFTNNPSHKPIIVKSFADYDFQAKYLVQEIHKIENLRDVAVLYRNNSSSISLVNEFDRAGIPFYMKDANNRFFSHWVVEDIMNFMRMTFTDKRPELLETIHMKLNVYITKQQIAAIKEIDNNESVFDNLLNNSEWQDYQVKQLNECRDTFQQMKGLPPLEAIRIIRSKLGYEKAIEKMCKRLGFRKDYLISILNTLEEIADTLESMESFAKRIKHLEVILKNSKINSSGNVVTFSTLHSSKGLEFEKVYMIDLIDDIIPSSDDIKGSEDGIQDLMEESVRLFYVGMTRAKRHLEMITYKKRDDEKVSESRFLIDVRNIIDPPKIFPKKEYKKQEVRKHGTTKKDIVSIVPHNPNAIKSRDQMILKKVVKHRVFGQGKIFEIEGDVIGIRFSSGIKKLSINACLDIGLLEPISKTGGIHETKYK